MTCLLSVLKHESKKSNNKENEEQQKKEKAQKQENLKSRGWDLLWYQKMIT
jgi:hypothetical protein